jgi:NAD(P)-dependent dehydrogenase (short-subunit alcohol dehydrogenase family)
MADRLKDKVALVVGAGSIGPGWGNGKAAAVAFAREGARVFCADINRAAAEETVGLIRAEGGEATAHSCDVSKGADVAAMVEACRSTYDRIDILDNNVGIAEVGGVVDVSESDWDRMFAVNLKGAFFAMKHAIPLMVRQGGGSIINISSIASIRYTGVPLCDVLRDQGRAQPSHSDYGGRICEPRSEGKCDSAGADEDPDGRKERGSRRKLRRRRCRGNVARARSPGSNGFRRRCLGYRMGRPSISQATKAAMSPESCSPSTAVSRSNTSELALVECGIGVARGRS